MTREKTECNYVNIRRASSAVSRYYEKTLKVADITITELSIMRSLNRHGNCSMTELSEAMGLERTTLVRNLKRPMGKAWIVDDSEEKTRNRQLALTEEGFLAMGRGNKLWEEAQAYVTKTLGADKMSALDEILTLLETL